MNRLVRRTRRRCLNLGGRVVLAGLLFFSLPAAAADLRFGTLSGRVAAGLACPDADATGYLAGDASYDLRLFGSAFGLELGVFGIATNADTPHETYGALTVGGEAFRLSLGVVRPAFDLFAPSPLERLVPVTGVSQPQVGATRSRVTWGAMFDGALPVGGSLVHHGGQLDWAVSAHRVDNKALSVTSLAARWDGGDRTVAAALESASDGTLAGKVAVTRDWGAFTAGLAGYAAPAPGFADLAEAHLTWRASDRLAVTGLMQIPTGRGDAQGALAATYALGGRGRLVAGITGQGSASSASLGLDWTF